MEPEEHFSYQEGPVSYCATHPSVETGLACSRCGKYICPRCMVQTPVGARCRQCARVQKLPVHNVQTQHYVVAGVVALAVGGVAGVAWGLLLAAVGWVIFLPSLLAMGVGYVIGEAVSASVNRKRSTGLAIIAGLGVVLAFVLSGLIGRDIPVVNIIFALLFLVVALYIAVSRVR